MLIIDFLGSLLRRWYVVLGGLLATMAAVVGVYANVPVTYEATASVVLIPPEESVAAGDNPYLYLGGLAQALSVVVITMNSAESHEQLVGDHQDKEYSVEQDVTTDGPIVTIRSVTNSEADAVELVQTIVDYVPVTLNRLQDSLDVSEKSRIGYLTLAQSKDIEVNDRRQVQLIGVALGGGVIGTLALAAALDRYLPDRRRRTKVREHRKARVAAENEELDFPPEADDPSTNLDHPGREQAMADKSSTRF